MNDTAMSVTAVEEATEDKVLHFRDGLPGFPRSNRFVLLDLAEDSAFQILQSLDETDVSFLVAVPWLFFPDYDFELSELEQRELGINQADETVVFSPVTIDAEQQTIYLNLLGPIVVNASNREGRQVVLVDSDLPVRAAVELG